MISTVLCFAALGLWALYFVLTFAVVPIFKISDGNEIVWTLQQALIGTATVLFYCVICVICVGIVLCA